jgi:hypothetical protein
MDDAGKKNELVAALCKARIAFKPIKKDRKNPHFGQKYATLDSVFESTVDALAQNGLVVVQQVTNANEKNITVKTSLLHTSGEKIESELTMAPERPGAQGAGSLITYLRRYTLQAILGVAADEDDDANVSDAKAEAPKANVSKTPHQDAFNALRKSAEKAGVMAKFTGFVDEWLTGNNLSPLDCGEKEYQKMVEYINEKRKPKKEAA